MSHLTRYYYEYSHLVCKYCIYDKISGKRISEVYHIDDVEKIVNLLNKNNNNKRVVPNVDYKQLFVDTKKSIY